MGQIASFTVSIVMVLAVLFMATLMMSDANTSGNYSNYGSYGSFNNTMQYAENLKNQTDTMQSSITQSSNSGVDALTSLNLLLQGGAALVSSTLGIFGVGFALLFDIGSMIGAPAYIIGLAIVGMTFVLLFQIARGLRMGDL